MAKQKSRDPKIKGSYYGMHKCYKVEDGRGLSTIWQFKNSCKIISFQAHGECCKQAKSYFCCSLWYLFPTRVDVMIFDIRPFVWFGLKKIWHFNAFFRQKHEKRLIQFSFLQTYGWLGMKKICHLIIFSANVWRAGLSSNPDSLYIWYSISCPGLLLTSVSQ